MSGESAQDVDPSKLLPIETARAALLHWWREPVAGVVSVIVGLWDTWHFGREGGLSTSVDELLVIGGIVLIAGSRKLFFSARRGGGDDDGATTKGSSP